MSGAVAQQDDMGLDFRSDLYSMLLPFFPEDTSLREFHTRIGNYSLRITADDPTIPIATPSDRKIMNLLAGAIARDIRAGFTPSRHLAIDVRTIAETLTEDGGIGGSQYARIIERLRRLMATVIETELPIGDTIARRRRFRWIDAYEHDDTILPSGRKMVGLKITISEDAFMLMTRSLGFNISRQKFNALTSGRSSIWRIYEICLGKIIARDGRQTFINIDELRKSVPIGSPLKVFKSRTLRSAIDSINSHPEMSRHIRIDLAMRNDMGGYEIIPFTQRAKLDRICVSVQKGPDPLPPLNRMLSKSEADDVIATARRVIPMQR